MTDGKEWQTDLKFDTIFFSDLSRDQSAERNRFWFSRSSSSFMPSLYFCSIFENVITSIPDHFFLYHIHKTYNKKSWMSRRDRGSIGNWIRKMVEMCTGFEVRGYYSQFIIHFKYFTKDFFLILMKLSNQF